MPDFRSTMDVELIRASGSDSDVGHAAWISTQDLTREYIPDSETRLPGLINFLMKNRHGTPFEHCTMTFRTTAPIFVWREHMRHRIASYNEESGRYKKLEPVFYVPNPDRPLQQEGKPGAYTFVAGTAQQVYFVRKAIEEQSLTAYTTYERLIKSGVAKEVARMVLPTNIYSSAYVTMNLRGLMNFLSLRTKDEDSLFPSYPMHEIALVAAAYEKLFAAQFPLTHAAFIKNRRVAP